MNDGTHELDDRGLRAALLRTGDRPTDAFRAELRSIMIDEASASGPTLRAVENAPTTARRRPWSVVLAAAAVLAFAVAGVVILSSRDEGSLVPGTVPASAPEVSAPIVERLRDMRWIATGEPWPLVPWLEFGASGIAGFDGCNHFEGIMRLDGDAISELQIASYGNDCGEDPGIAPAEGDHLVLSADGGFVLTDASGSVRASFEALDSSQLASNGSDIMGIKSLDVEHNVQILDDKYFAIGTCGVLWDFDQGLRVTGWPTNSVAGCVEDGAIAAQQLVEMLQEGNRVETRLSGNDLLLVDEGLVIRLRDCSGTDCNPVAEVEEVDRLLEVVGARRWVLDNVGGEYPFALLPFVEFPTDPLEGPLITGYDGCNWFGLQGSWNVDRVGEGVISISADASGESTAIGCDGDRGDISPGAGDAVIPEGVRLVFQRSDGGTPLEYVALDSLPPLAEASQLVGTWRLDDGARLLTVDGATDPAVVTFGACSWRWSFGGGELVTDELPDDPYGCLDGSSDETSARFVEMLTAVRPTAVHIVADAARLYLASGDGQFVFRLARQP